MKNLLRVILSVILLTTVVPNSHALSVLGTDQHLSEAGYGARFWSHMTFMLDVATDNHFDTVNRFDDFGQMLNYDAIWLDTRAFGETLGTTEYTNIINFIATGRRVVLLGEHRSWVDWNSQILSMVGGTHDGRDYGGFTHSVVSNELTNNASLIDLPYGGVVMSGGGLSLYDVNFATLWGDNVLTVLDVSLFSDGWWHYGRNYVFATNVANWIANSEAQPVPEPSTLLLLVSGLVGLRLYSRRKARKSLSETT